jgi:hypothetical protein
VTILLSGLCRIVAYLFLLVLVLIGKIHKVSKQRGGIRHSELPGRGGRERDGSGGGGMV